MRSDTEYYSFGTLTCGTFPEFWRLILGLFQVDNQKLAAPLFNNARIRSEFGQNLGLAGRYGDTCGANWNLDVLITLGRHALVGHAFAQACVDIYGIDRAIEPIGRPAPAPTGAVTIGAAGVKDRWALPDLGRHGRIAERINLTLRGVGFEPGDGDARPVIKR